MPGFKKSIPQLLFDATKAGKLRWKFLREAPELIGGPGPKFGRHDIIGEPMYSEWKGTTYRLFEYRFKYYFDEDMYEWQYGVSIEIATAPLGNMMHEFSGEDLGRDLLVLARNQAVDIVTLRDELASALEDDEDA
jgi:hypothetical protein